jgi:hypothetical protein
MFHTLDVDLEEKDGKIHALIAQWDTDQTNLMQSVNLVKKAHIMKKAE